MLLNNTHSMSTLLKTLLTDASAREAAAAKDKALESTAYEPWDGATY